MTEIVWWAGLVGLLFAATLSGAGGRIVEAVFGEAFAYSGRILRILALAAVPHFLNTVVARTLWAEHKIWSSVRVAGVNLVLNVLLNIVLIPRWGAMGASVATLVTLMAGLVQNVWILRRTGVHVPIGLWFLRGSVAAATTWGVMRVVVERVHVAGVFAAPVVFSAVLGALGERSFRTGSGRFGDADHTLPDGPAPSKGLPEEST